MACPQTVQGICSYGQSRAWSAICSLSLSATYLHPLVHSTCALSHVFEWTLVQPSAPNHLQPKLVQFTWYLLVTLLGMLSWQSENFSAFSIANSCAKHAWQRECPHDSVTGLLMVDRLYSNGNQRK